MIRKDFNSSGLNDEFSVLNYQHQKNEYSRSKLIELNKSGATKAEINPRFEEQLTRSQNKCSVLDELMEGQFQLPLHADSKVDRWLNSGENATKYATASAEIRPDPLHFDSEVQAKDNVSVVTEMSATSSMRSKLLDKTAKLKENLRNLTQNKN